MNKFHKVIRSFSFLEAILYKRVRLPFQYFVQKSIFALDPEFKILKQLIYKDKISIDIGANKGIYAYFLSKRCKHVYCFEPLKECCDYINNYSSKDITVINNALSSLEGALEMYVPVIKNRHIYTRSSLKRPNCKYEKRTVIVNTLDCFNYKNVGFIKIDVEGVEMSVLEGAIKTIKQSKPNLLVEIDIHQHTSNSFNQVFEFLYNLGYKSFITQSKQLIPYSNIQAIEEKKYYNFIFIRERV